MKDADHAAPRSADAEARHATILKCDLVGSTRTKKPLDLDGQLAFQRGCEQIVTQTAARYNAHIERFEGDGAMVVFGFPHPREDAAEAAISMGLDLIRSIQDADIVRNVRLQTRVGIASGVIAVINRPTNPKGDLIAGLTIDLAERLRALAEPDQIVISDATRRLAAGFFRYDDLGRVVVKGFDEGVQAWRVAGPSAVSSRFEAQRYDPSRSDIIGRADALQLLAQAWDAARQGSGRAVCLVGDAGIGKSRLARAATDAAAADGATTLKIDCTPSTENTPLFPVGVMLRNAAGITAGGAAAEPAERARQLLARLLPAEEVAAALPYLAPLFGLDGIDLPADVAPAEAHERTIATIVGLLGQLAAERPLAVICEDLHWVDHTTAQVIARVAAGIAGQRVLLIVTMRPSADAPPVDLAAFTTIRLHPLDGADAAELVRVVARYTPLPEDAVRRIVERCEGVPLVIEEVTRSALEAGSRPYDPTEAIAAFAVPAPLQLVVQSRLARRPHYAPIVQSASILGRTFSVGLLAKMLPPEERQDLAEVVDVLVRDGLFVEPEQEGPGRARFKHAMICDAVYNTLLGSHRRQLHSDVADALMRDYAGTPDAAPDVVAEHLRQAGRAVEAIRLRLAESVRTAAHGAFVETEGHCLAALALLDEVTEPAGLAALRFRLLIQLGVALTGRHGYAAAVVEDAYRRAQAACGDSAEAEMLYPIMRGLATVNLVRGNLPTAYDLSLQALQLAEQSTRAEFRIDAMSVLCYTTLYYGRLEDCRGWIDRCLQHYHAEQGHRLTYPVPQDAATAAIALLPTVAWLLGDAHAAEQAVQDGLAHVERLDCAFDRALLHSWIAGTRYTQRRYAEVIEHAQTAIAIAQQHGYREWYGTGALLCLLAQIAVAADPQTLAAATETCQQFAREGVGLNASYYLWGLARGHASAGDHPSARALLLEAGRRAEASAETRMNAELLILEAELTPDDAAALALLDRALALAEAQGAVPTALRAAAAIALRGGHPAAADHARATLDLLDGRAPYPNERDWMHDRLARLRARDAAPSAAQAVVAALAASVAGGPAASRAPG